MATLVPHNADNFALSTASATASVPFALGALMRRISRFENTIMERHGNTSTNKVTLIKYIRETIFDSAGHPLGLKDAKDIADHYYNSSDQE